MAEHKLMRPVSCMMRLRSRPVWVALLLLAAQMGWAPVIGAAGSQAAVRITDFRGAPITVEKPARRIVCLIESALSGLYMLGVQEKVVGISTNIYQQNVFAYYAAMDARIVARQLPTPGNWDFVNLESVVALAPDLVIVWAHQSEAIAAMEERGLRVYGVQIACFADISKEISDLGALTDSRKRAQELTDDSSNELEHLHRQADRPDAPSRPGVYFMWAQGDLETSGRPSTVDDLITLAGGRNVCGHIHQEHLAVHLEELLQWNPDVVVMWPNPSESPQSIMAKPVWRSIRSVRERRVHELPSVFLCDLWTLKYQFAVRLMTEWCHPTGKSRADLVQEARAMLGRLYGKAAAERMPVEEAFP
jgi:iron complex transport system substrate-binding protein